MIRITVFSFIISVLLFNSLYSQTGQWNYIRKTPSVNVNDLQFLQDGNNGWAVGNSTTGTLVVSALFKTTDSGNQWALVNFPGEQTSAINGVFFADQNTGWICGKGGVIYYTTNSGVSWVQQFATSRLLAKMHFLNNNTGYAVGGWQDGSSYLVLKTTNGGTNWQDLSFGSTAYSVEAVFFIDANTGWIGCRNNQLYPQIQKTTDGGATWTAQNTGLPSTNIGIVSIAFTNANKGWASVSSINISGNVLYTNDGGTTWTTQYSTGEHYNYLAVKDSNNIAVVGKSVLGTGAEKVCVSSNGGTSWNTYVPPINAYTNAIAYVNNSIWLGSAYSQIIRSTNGGANFVFQNQSPSWRSIGWGSAQNGWAVAGYNGASNFTLRTTNAGVNWFYDNNAPGGCKVQFVNQNTGFTLWDGNGGSVWKTTNGGTNWTRYYTTLPAWASDMFFVDANTGWVCGGSGGIKTSTNGGVSWTSQTSGTSQYLDKIFFVSVNEGWACGGYGSGNGVIIHTTNGGSTWTPQTPATSMHNMQMWFINNNEGWVAGVNGGTAKTTDGGSSWVTGGTIPHPYVEAMYFLNSQTGWVAGRNQSSGGQDGKGFIYKTSDGGNSWNLEFTADLVNGSIGGIAVDPQNFIWAAGNHDYILKYSLPVGIEKNTELVNDYSLSQNYPNPFNPVTKIRFAIPKSGFTTLKIYDMLGKEFQTLVNKNLQLGTYEASFDGSNLNSGVYFYRLQTGSFTDTKKMLLIK